MNDDGVVFMRSTSTKRQQIESLLTEAGVGALEEIWCCNGADYVIVEPSSCGLDRQPYFERRCDVHGRCREYFWGGEDQ